MGICVQRELPVNYLRAIFVSSIDLNCDAHKLVIHSSSSFFWGKKSLRDGKKVQLHRGRLGPLRYNPSAFDQDKALLSFKPASSISALATGVLENRFKTVEP